MYDFQLQLPTKVIFGAGSVSRLGEITKEFGRRAFVITYDQALMEDIGIWQKITASLCESDIDFVSFFGVKSNPTIEHTREAINKIRENKPDVIIAVGGGSVIDEAKTIGIGVMYDGDVWDLCAGVAPITASLPVIAVVTIPATSSEMNCTSVMSNDALRRKDGFASPFMYPKIALLDPELTYTIPVKQTAYSAADIISHAFEAYLPHTNEWAPFQNRYAEGVVKTIIECMDRLLENPGDTDARAMMMWTATYTWNGFFVCGLGRFDNPIHILGHSLSAFYDLPHGASMSITIPAYMKSDIEPRKKRFAGCAREIFGVEKSDDLAAAKEGIDLLVQWFKKIGTPTTFAEAKIPANELDALAKDAVQTANAWGLGDLWTEERALAMFEMAL